MALTITATSAAALGSSQITISATSPGAAARTQVLSLNMAALPGYMLAVTNPNLSAQVNTAAVFKGTITAVNGYSASVTLSCGAGAPATCTASPATVVPSSSGVPFSVTVSSASAGSYAFNINGVDGVSTTHIAPVTFTALANQNFDFAMSAAPGSVAVIRGKTALFNLSVDPNTGTFPSTVSLSCAGLPALTSCNFNPAQLASGSGSSVISVSMTTTAPTPAAAAMLLGLPLCGILLTPLSVKGRRRLSRFLLFISVAMMLVSCGGGLEGGGGGGGAGSPGTKPGDYTITLTATCGTVTHSTPVTLTVTP